MTKEGEKGMKQVKKLPWERGRMGSRSLLAIRSLSRQGDTLMKALAMEDTNLFGYNISFLKTVYNFSLDSVG
jgi:hypothetical protein